MPVYLQGASSSTRTQEEKDEMKDLIEQVKKLSTEVTYLRNQIINSKPRREIIKGVIKETIIKTREVTKGIIKIETIKETTRVVATREIIRITIIKVVASCTNKGITISLTKRGHGTRARIMEMWFRHLTIKPRQIIGQLIEYF
jgi:hypothetical protein